MPSETVAEFCLIARNNAGQLMAVTVDGSDEAAAFRRGHERAGHTVERLPTGEARRLVRDEGLAPQRDDVF